MGELGNENRREAGRLKNNRVENSHLPFRRKGRVIQRFCRMKSLQKFANVHNHFISQRRLINRQSYKAARSAALVEWQISWLEPALGKGLLGQSEQSSD